MDSIVLELQSEAMASDSNVSDLLRKSLVIASKLEIKDFEDWVKQEINGYRDNLDNIPDYREVRGSLQYYAANNGSYFPAILLNPIVANYIKQNKLPQSITELESLLKSEKESIFIIPSEEIQKELRISFKMETKFRITLERSQVQKIIDMVKTIILEWSLQLEKDGILGEGIKFSQKEKQVADKQNYTVNNFYVNVSGLQIQQHTQNSTQIQINEIDIEKVSKIISDLQKHLSQTELSEEKQKAIEKEIEAITKQLTENKPKKNVIKESIKTIRGLLEGVAGNLIAEALVNKINEII